jgi:hypothetical protein
MFFTPHPPVNKNEKQAKSFTPTSAEPIGVPPQQEATTTER